MIEIRDTDRVFISNISNLKHKFRISREGQQFYFITDDGKYLNSSGTISNSRQGFIITDMDGNVVNNIIEGYDYMLMYNGQPVVFRDERDTINLRFKIDNTEEPTPPPPEPVPPPPAPNIPNNPNRGRVVINKTTNINSTLSTVMLIIFISVIFFIVIIVLMFLVFFIRKYD